FAFGPNGVDGPTANAVGRTDRAVACRGLLEGRAIGGEAETGSDGAIGDRLWRQRARRILDSAGGGICNRHDGFPTACAARLEAFHGAPSQFADAVLRLQPTAHATDRRLGEARSRIRAISAGTTAAIRRSGDRAPRGGNAAANGATGRVRGD